MEEDEIMRTAELDETLYDNLDRAIEALDRYWFTGDNVCIEFNGQKLYSLLDDRDSCYKKVTGLNYDDFMRERKDLGKKSRQKEIEAQLAALEKVPEWKQRGYAIIYPQQRKAWDNCIKSRITGIYHGLEIEPALKIMESLAKDSDLKKAFEVYTSSGSSGGGASSIRDIVLNFSEMGTLFYRYSCLKENIEIDKERENLLKDVDDKFQSYQIENEDM